jgi:Zn ribbon nucleic-acid-binding protein
MVKYTGECPKCGHDKYHMMNASMPIIKRCVKCGFDWNPDQLHVPLKDNSDGESSAEYRATSRRGGSTTNS